MIVLVTGVAGTGKTTVGKLLADELGWEFRDADEFHPRANIEKMARGEPLDDGDRKPWLKAMREVIEARVAKGENAVLTCSALKRAYRDDLRFSPEVKVVYLFGKPELLELRLKKRQGHFMGAGMLASQLATLEKPDPEEAALMLDVAETPDVLVGRIRDWIGVDSVNS